VAGAASATAASVDAAAMAKHGALVSANDAAANNTTTRPSPARCLRSHASMFLGRCIHLVLVASL
jgi:hypothetical protein